ncbi:MAG TPA: hypothetical protein VGE58_06035 [Daejeonella sp.]
MTDLQRDIDFPSTDFQKGFNEGYLIRQHLPELANELQRALQNSTSDRSQGFTSGVKQYQLETQKSFKPDWRSHENLDDKDMDRANERDRSIDDPEPEL